MENRTAQQNQFAMLYDKYYKAVYHTSLGILHDAAEAEDCMQEAFAALWKGLDQDAVFTNPGAWLMQVVRNISLNSLRKYGRMVEWENMEDIPTTDDETSRLPEDEMFITQVLACLPETERTVFTLHVLGGLRLSEIAKILGVPASTARWRYSAARKLLKVELRRQTYTSDTET